MIINLQGIPVEFVFTPGSEADVQGFKRFECDFMNESKIYADKAYTDYIQEDLLQEACGIQMVPKRKKNSKRKNSPFNDFFLSLNRNKIETTFSAIVNLMPRCIRAVTAKGFCLKPNLPPMKAVIFEVIFSLEARTKGSENKGAIFQNIAPLFLRSF
jgi:Transposase DDE domain